MGRSGHANGEGSSWRHPDTLRAIVNVATTYAIPVAVPLDVPNHSDEEEAASVIGSDSDYQGLSRLLKKHLGSRGTLTNGRPSEYPFGKLVMTVFSFA